MRWGTGGEQGRGRSLTGTWADQWGEAVGRPALTAALSLPLADCKYKFESWGSCDGGSGTKARQGTLKKARYNAQCQETIRVTKPCTPKTKAKTKGQPGERGAGSQQGAAPTCEGNGFPGGLGPW